MYKGVTCRNCYSVIRDYAGFTDGGFCFCMCSRYWMIRAGSHRLDYRKVFVPRDTWLITGFGTFVLFFNAEGRKFLRIRQHEGGWKTIALARLMMECKLGRDLSATEVVHHIDHDHTNDVLENLMVMENCDHLQYHRAAARQA